MSSNDTTKSAKPSTLENAESSQSGRKNEVQVLRYIGEIEISYIAKNNEGTWIRYSIPHVFVALVESTVDFSCWLLFIRKKADGDDSVLITYRYPLYPGLTTALKTQFNALILLDYGIDAAIVLHLPLGFKGNETIIDPLKEYVKVNIFEVKSPQEPASDTAASRVAYARFGLNLSIGVSKILTKLGYKINETVSNAVKSTLEGIEKAPHDAKEVVPIELQKAFCDFSEGAATMAQGSVQMTSSFNTIAMYLIKVLLPPAKKTAIKLLEENTNMTPEESKHCVQDTEVVVKYCVSMYEVLSRSLSFFLMTLVNTGVDNIVTVISHKLGQDALGNIDLKKIQQVSKNIEKSKQNLEEVETMLKWIKPEQKETDE